ncbi:hypothetical protein CHS0354_028302 [Potamilus streckersoni]|uniref:GATOR complex protein NPRL3 n=1 Tax=Potamilus streckersoni TaxID=2493646 RepID=A0AAE0RTZ4_9BIVA|nr:hypothetical protein CHS0354_028302 [Potamilus streckersoni]
MIMPSSADCVSIIFVTSGTRGDRLLFRYPIEFGESVKTLSKSTKKNPYAVKVAEDLLSSKNKVASCILKRGRLTGITDGTIESILGVKSNLCSQKFDIKIDDVRFLGFPMLLDDIPDKQTPTGKTAHKILSFNVAFVVKSSASSSVVDCFHNLAKQLSVALKHEEKRCQYLSSQAKIMTAVHDDVAALPEDSLELPYSLILKKSEFAKNLKVIYESLKCGVVHIYLNNWVEVNFILPHKIHYILLGEKACAVEPEAIRNCLDSVRPYHGMLLLEEETTLLETLPVDCNPALVRLIHVSKPVRNLQTLALEADLSLSQVFRLVCHLVYWGKATIIYPLCETNTYVLSPMANTLVSSQLVRDFEMQFEGTFLPTIMSEFSFPTQMQDTRNILNDQQQQDRKVQMVVWLLQHHLLMQLHTYISFVAPVSHRRLKTPEEMLRKLPVLDDKRDNSDECLNRFHRSHSLSDIASVNSDESMGPVANSSSMMSKSPSVEFTADISLFSEEVKAFLVQDSGLNNLTVEEQEAIMNVPATQNLEDIKLFAKLLPYFNGKHHLEEIMYYENMRRSQLLTLLEKFRDVLIMCSFQDPADTFYVRC